MIAFPPNQNKSIVNCITDRGAAFFHPFGKVSNVNEPNPMPDLTIWMKGGLDPSMKEMAIYSILAWDIPRTEEPGGL